MTQYLRSTLSITVSLSLLLSSFAFAAPVKMTQETRAQEIQELWSRYKDQSQELARINEGLRDIEIESQSLQLADEMIKELEKEIDQLMLSYGQKTKDQRNQEAFNQEIAKKWTAIENIRQNLDQKYSQYRGGAKDYIRKLEYDKRQLLEQKNEAIKELYIVKGNLIVKDKRFEKMASILKKKQEIEVRLASITKLSKSLAQYERDKTNAEGKGVAATLLGVYGGFVIFLFAEEVGNRGVLRAGQIIVGASALAFLKYMFLDRNVAEQKIAEIKEVLARESQLLERDLDALNDVFTRYEKLMDL